ncbi:bifunctional 4-hydroxy-2-oxoglutarate aldolase/2-dehydro-3-deoxy-phosphogluconate aldolase [Actinomadura opuntiae]|uniref:bifunctional 4-hydroxy-2-oxoglutarate aldolase/2-dehydro-3-deoxy-phosphogluconate aldolase n=1 Tax=Actinomadura sp. OS1-43 TaxID=604315 RepID=UPI00255ADB25|nr:bifunctional 4-hydroxy-2-oxoglutarate aldolase/2-dehydro-3-deoxy-phosphogluconate aldolase [Actinomadura sp. OS1-43]MDL4816166.1 bifunctional 4-hydroxy-2-oxoglutarate aldolase/2-dehydro-3-deoxy-phosphogluconate aldolase [Actinomadura sp. OS1-43]
MNTDDLFGLAPVVPVVVLHDADHAVPLARALVEGGLPAIEVTLRTPAAVESIERIAAEVPDAVVGAGTVVTAEDAERSRKAGARFLVSPGCTPRLRAAMAETGLPFLPGVSSASEAMALLEEGITAMKFFPAEPAGGVPYLKALGGPLPQIRFCPTGGIRPGNAADYLALPNVGCVGGTWLTPSDALGAGDWDRVRVLAAEAAKLRPA